MSEVSQNDCIKYFILGRSFSKFSGEKVKQNQNSAWGNWYQVQRILKEFKSNQLNNLFDELIKEFTIAKESKLTVKEEVIEIEGIKFYLEC